MNDTPIQELPRQPEPHPIIELVRKGTISMYQLSLRIEKSYFHTANIVSGRAKVTPEIQREFDIILMQMETNNDGKNKKKDI